MPCLVSRSYAATLARWALRAGSSVLWTAVWTLASSAFKAFVWAACRAFVAAFCFATSLSTSR
eukprot:11345297-Alexandrium_andersonii.AAC.1